MAVKELVRVRIEKCTLKSSSRSTKDTVRLTVTLPVYKDTSFLEKACETIEEMTPTITTDFVLQIAEDGSDSSSVVDALKGRYRNILYTHRDQRLGRGKALREAWGKVEGDVYVYLDVDLATDMAKFDAYRNLLNYQETYDLVTGSRYVPGSETNRPFLRGLSSIVYNSLVRLVFRTGVHDHQCGFKSFSRRLVQALSTEAKSASWFWDTEVIVIAKRLGFRIKEIPIHWTERKGERTPIKRLLKDIWVHGSGMLGLVWRVYFSKRHMDLKSHIV